LFSGKIKTGEFLIDDIRVIDNPIHKEEDVLINAVFFTGNDGKKKKNYLTELTSNLSFSRKKREEDVKNWSEYIEWKKELTRLRIQAIKYIAFEIDISEKQVAFLAVIDDETKFESFKKCLFRNEVSVFSNNYSMDKYLFKINTNDMTSDGESGVPLNFIEMRRPFTSDHLNTYRWNRCKKSARKNIKCHTRNESVMDLLNGLKEAGIVNYKLVELRFGFSENANTLIQQSLRQHGIIVDGIERQLAGEFFPEGFIATSQVGDFALLRRLKRGIDDYISGKSVSAELEHWLFDISKAKANSNISPIRKWQNKQLNESQKRAVEIIVSAPDVCLVQGPPGTGKTTVIAESIYQFVSQQKRVLVASQANLAVDNALERLIQNPKIRAIRLGNSRKMSDSVSNITEENVLEDFYSVLVKYIENEYESKWNQHETDRKRIEEDYRKAIEAEESISSINKKIAEEINANSRKENDAYVKIMRQLESYQKRRQSLEKTISFCKGLPTTVSFEEDPKLAFSVNQNTSPLRQILFQNGIILSAYQSIESINPLNTENENSQIAKSIIEGLITIFTLSKKVKSSSVALLASLKSKCEKLSAKLDSDDSFLEEWRSVRNQIKELESQGASFSLTDKEELFFTSEIRQIEDKEERLSLIQSVLDKNSLLLNEMLRMLLELFDSRMNEYSNTINTLKERKQQIEKFWNDYKEKLDALSQKLHNSSCIISELQAQYAIEDTSNVSSFLFEKLQETDDNFGDVRKADWAPIFTGFKNWISNIPDYNNERAVYLESFINGCNVVGVSCTENSRTLKDSGFDDFDVVIIDEVSKATPPELLIPMLKGKKLF
jgi:hypothetical protein